MTVLTVLNLAERMADAAARAEDPELRFENETDAVLFGKLTLLDSLAESVWMHDQALTPEEERAMQRAQKALSAAWDRLADVVFPLPAIPH